MSMIPNSLRKAGSQEASLTAGRCKCEAATQQKGPSSPPASIASYSTQKRTCRPRLPRTAMTTLIWQETAGNVRRPAMVGGGAYYTLVRSLAISRNMKQSPDYYVTGVAFGAHVRLSAASGSVHHCIRSITSVTVFSLRDSVCWLCGFQPVVSLPKLYGSTHASCFRQVTEWQLHQSPVAHRKAS
jgi:hypothetical protein